MEAAERFASATPRMAALAAGQGKWFDWELPLGSSGNFVKVLYGPCNRWYPRRGCVIFG